MVNLDSIEGLNEEQKASLLGLFDKEVGGLKNKVDEIIKEKRAVQQSVTEKEQALEDARKAASKAHEDKLIADGKTDELKAHYEEQLAQATAELTSSAEKSKALLLDRDKKDILRSVETLVSDDYRDISAPMLSNMLNISYNDEGEAVPSFEYNGKVVATNVDEFKGWASEQPAFQKILKGVESSGASTTQSHSGSAANGGEDAAFQQRLKDAGLT